MADSTLSQPRKYIVASWTTLNIPLSSTFEDEGTEEGKKWISIIRPLTSEKQPGFLHGIWGRVIESPEVVWLVTAWESPEALDAFEKSSTYATQSPQLASMSSSPPTTLRCHFSGFFWNRLTEYTGITDVYFPSSIVPETREKLRTLRGLAYFMSPGRTEPKAYNGNGTRGWIQETVDREGKEIVVMRFINYWMSEEKEDDFKKTSPIMVAGEGKLVYDHFVDGLKAAGMLEMNERHCNFSHIPLLFWDNE